MRLKQPILILLAALALTLRAHCAQAPVLAPTPRTRMITSDEAIQLALTNDVDILISRQNPFIDKFSLSALYTSYDPVLGFSASHSFYNVPAGIDPETGSTVSFIQRSDNFTPTLSDELPTGTQIQLTGPVSHDTGPAISPFGSYTGDVGISLDQPLLRNLWIDTPRMNIAVARQTLRYDQLALRLQVMTTVDAVLSDYYNLIYDRENVEVEKEAVKLAEELANEDRQKAQLGAMTPLDASSADAQAAASRSDLLTAQLTLVNQENTFKSLLALDLSEWANVTPVPTEQLVAVPENPSIVDCWRTALDFRPDILQAKVSLEKQKITIKYDFNQLFPELDVQAQYAHNGAGSSLDKDFGLEQRGSFRTYSYGATLNVPLDNIGARSTYKGARATLEQLVLQYKKVQNTVIVAVQNDVAAVQSDLLKIDSSRTARVYAEEALTAEKTKLDRGSSTTLLVLQAQQTLTQDRSAEIRALADYNIALQQLAFDEGIILERNKISWSYP